MRQIEYHAPASLAEAVEILAKAGPRARPLAGGTDLIVQLREYRSDADVIVDVKRVPELTELRLDGDGLVIGAAVPCCRIYEDEQIARAYPAVFDAASLIGGIQIQNRASLGGNLCNASPAADGVPPLIAHGGTCRIAGPSGEREVPVEKFCVGPGKTVLERGELLVSIRLPRSGGRSGSRYERFIPRNEMDIAVAGAGSFIELEDDGETIRSARVGLAAVAPTPLALANATDALAGRKATAEAFAEVAEAARKAARPIRDMRGEIWQRRHLAGVLTRRTLEVALERARAAGNGTR